MADGAFATPAAVMSFRIRPEDDADQICISTSTHPDAMAKRHVVEFEDSLVYAQGGIEFYRKGIDKFYLSHGLPRVHRSLEAARQDLEALGMFERCREALVQAEELVRKGPEHDYDAETLILGKRTVIPS